MKVHQLVSEKKKNANNSGNWIAVGITLGAVFFGLTREPV
jgi:hypothetical protein